MKKAELLIIPFLLASCNHLPDWMGAGEDPPLPGERFSVMSLDNALEPDESIKFEEVDIPPQSKDLGNSSEGNHYIAGDLTKVSSVNIGSSADDYFFITSKPIYAANRVFVMDGEHSLHALDLNMKQIWQSKIEAPEDKQSYPTGGIAANEGFAYITTGFGDVVAVNTADGSEIWRRNVGMPVRNAPVIANNKLYVITTSNDLYVFDGETGESLWRHSGVAETTKIYGSAAPAVKNAVTVAAYSSGEIFGINNEQGIEIWTELLSLSSDRTKASASINDITASPIIVDGIVYVTSHTGNISAFNLTNGFRIWEQPIASGTNVYVAGRHLYITGDDGKVLALNRFDGRVKWVSQLPLEDGKSIFYSGPVMAGNMLLIVSSNGELLKLDPKTGNIISQLKIPENVYAPISVFNGRVYLYSNDAKLIQIN